MTIISQAAAKFKVPPLQSFTIILSIYTLCALLHNLQKETFIHLGICLGGGLVFFFLFSYLFKKPKNIYNTVISCLIIFLLWNPISINASNISESFLGWALTFALVGLAVSFKFFLEYKNISWINPAVFGLLMVSFFNRIFQLSPFSFTSWWGASYGSFDVLSWQGANYGISISFILIILYLLAGFHHWRKWWIIAVFLLGNALFIGGTFGLERLLFVFTDATIYFLALIMLVDPKSSPVSRAEQIFYGGIALLCYQLFFYLNLPEYDLLAIFAANLLNFGFRFKMLHDIAQKQKLKSVVS